MYFKRIQSRRCRRLEVISYIKVLSDGKNQVIDLTRMKISIITSYGSLPLRLEKSSAAEFNKAKKLFMKHHNLL